MTNNRPTKEMAEEAVRTLIRWAGDDPSRKELLETPSRVVKSYAEFFAGYNHTKADLEKLKIFENTSNYSDMIMLSKIRVESMCEHHMVPIIGNACVAYYPDKKIIGLSKLARIVDINSKRLQLQERLTINIADMIREVTEALGVAVIIESSHHCMTTRGIHKVGALMQTTHMMGKFSIIENRREFLENARNALGSDK